MKTAARKSAGIKSLIVCFYCNETFRSFSLLLQHKCPEEEKTSLGQKSPEGFSGTNDVDLSLDWDSDESLADAENCESAKQDSVITESASEKTSDISQEIAETDSITNDVSDYLLSQTNEQTLSEKKSSAAEQEIRDLASFESGKQLLEGNLDIIREVTESSSDALERQLLEGDLDIIKELLESTSDALDKQLQEESLDVVSEKATESSSEAYGKQLLNRNLILTEDNTEPASEKPSDIRQEINEANSYINVSENSFPDTKTECERTLSEKKSNGTEQEIKDLASDAPEKQLLEGNLDIIREVIESFSVALEKQSLEESLKVAKGENSVSSSEAPEKQLSEGNSDIVKEVIDLPSDALLKPLPVPKSGSEPRDTKVETNTFDNFTRDTQDLISTVLQCYEKQTKHEIPDSYKSSSTEMEFQASHPPLSAIESGSPRNESTQMECSTTGMCNNVLSSETKCDTDGEHTIQKESDILEKDVKGLEFHNSNSVSRVSLSEVDSSDMLSRSSSVEMDLDSLGYGDDQAESDDSDVSSSVDVSEKKSDILKSEQMQVELHTSKTSNKTLTENLDIKMYGSVILKPCYVEIEDIFKTLKTSKLSSKNIFSEKKKYHVCHVCTKFFRLKSDLITHYLTHSTEKPYECNKCGKSFVKENNLIAHHFHHTIKKLFACSVCKIPFRTKSALIKHKQIHFHKRPFACDKCDKSYCSKGSLAEHYVTHSDERPFICEICNASFKNKRYLRKHYYRNPHEEKENVCEFCFKTFKYLHNLEEHYNIHVNKKPHQCKFCDKSFHLLLTLNHHNFTFHKKENNLEFLERGNTKIDYTAGKNPIIQKIEKPTMVNSSEETPVQETEIHDSEKSFACDKCNTSYGSKASLIEHYLTHSKKNSFICEVCNASFKNKNTLRKHYYRNPHRENICEICDKVFKHAHHLEEHYNIHLNKRPHKCKICGKLFPLLLTLNHHYFSFHKKSENLESHESVNTVTDCKGGKNPIIQKIEKSDVISDSEKTSVPETDNDKCKETLQHSARRKSSSPKTEKPFKCYKCGKSFVKQSNLFTHHFIHTIKKQHACSICKKKFVKKSALLKHKLIHQDKKSFACDKCNKSYGSKASLTEHYLTHSKEKPFICNASFKNKKCLHNHHGRNPHKENVCEICDKVFKRAYHLEEHYNIHSNKRPHKCNICGKSFNLLLTLNHHYFKCHKKNENLEIHESANTVTDCQGGKDPIIQKIEKSNIISGSEKTSVPKTEETDNKCKETLRHSSRRKSSNPKKYLYSDSFVL